LPHPLATPVPSFCPSPRTWMPIGISWNVAPTAHDNEGTAATNPDFDQLLRGTVHDPTTRRMGGVAGHAGVFSTAHDISLYAQALLDKLLHNTGPFPLKQSTLQLMTQPEQPDPTHPGAPGPDSRTRASTELAAANAADQAAIKAGDKPSEPGLAPHYPAIKGQDLRGFGWDIDTAFSKPRGSIFPIGSFGHTGFTGTSLWMDPASDTYVILLANAIHPRGNPPISTLRGQVATAAAEALGLGKGFALKGTGFSPSVTAPEKTGALAPEGTTLTGIDVLEATHFAALTCLHHLGLLTNQSGIDAHGHRTIDILHALPSTLYSLLTIFSPEHGLSGTHDTEKFAAETDPATGLPVTSLYGAHDADRRPSHDQLKDLDAVVIDLQDAGVRTYTYPAVTGYFLEAAAREKSDFDHDLAIVILDRPNLIDGSDVQGPVSDPGHEGNYNDYMRLPLRHGLTLGEFARYVNAQKHLDAHLIVVPMQHWSRSEYMDQTGFPADGRWINPSPNLRNQTAAILLPALTLLETTNVSVGRGTALPFELFGAGVPPKPSALKGTGSSPSVTADQKNGALAPEGNPAGQWFHAADIAAALNARHIPGVTFEPTTTQVDEDPIHPYHGQTIQAVRIRITDRTALDSPELNIEILSVLHTLYPSDLKLAKAATFLASQSTFDALTRGDDPRAIATTWQPALTAFRAATTPYLLYP